MRDPIYIRCEGSNEPGNEFHFGYVVCAMCGQAFQPKGTVVPQHDRQDVLAMLNRGDFK